MSQNLVQSYPKIIWDEMSSFPWLDRKTVQMQAVLHPSYSCQQVEFDRKFYDDIKYPGDLTWSLIQNYMLPNFRSPTPFGKEDLQQRTFAMSECMYFFFTLKIFHIVVFRTGLKVIMKSPFYPIKDTHTIDSFLLQKCCQIETSDMWRGMFPPFYATHNQSYHNFISDVKQAQRQLSTKQTNIRYVGNANALKNYENMPKETASNEIVNNYSTLSMMTVCVHCDNM